ncbi:Peptide chain release factor 3 OS=Lysinibacillus sphaericus OX=1421 GN=prfC PE=3 SV=1 [Lysinibacillus sphaericus]
MTQSTQFLADDRETVDVAVAGDIIGLYDTGTYQIGDTVVGGKKTFQFEKLHRFST